MRLSGKAVPSRRAIDAVLSILRSSPNGISTQEIYKRAMPTALPQESVEAVEESPFQSIRYLKKTVLATLQEKGTIEKFHRKRENTTEEEMQEIKAKMKKKSIKVSKFAWYWRIHSWKESVARAGDLQAGRVDRKKKKATEAPEATSLLEDTA